MLSLTLQSSAFKTHLELKYNMQNIIHEGHDNMRTITVTIFFAQNGSLISNPQCAKELNSYLFFFSFRKHCLIENCEADKKI